MTRSPVKQSRALRLPALIKDYDRVLRRGVALRSFALAFAALFVAGLIDTNEDLIKSSPWWSSIAKILKNGLEAASGAIVVYYLIERRMAKIREEMESAIRLIRGTDVLSAVFEVALDKTTTEAWQNQIKQQEMTGILSRIDLLIILNVNHIKYRLYITDDILSLRNINENKEVILGPNESDSWACLGVKIKKENGDDVEVAYDKSLGGKQTQVYCLQVKEDEKFVREIELEKLVPLEISQARINAQLAGHSKQFPNNLIIDNHVFASGSQRLTFSAYIDVRLLSVKSEMEGKVTLTLPGKSETANVISRSRQYNRVPDVDFVVYASKPEFVFLPYQGFSYSVKLDGAAA